MPHTPVYESSHLAVKPCVVCGKPLERHGLYVRDLELFAAAIRRSVLAGFTPCDDCRHDHPGWTTTPDNRAARCACWLAWTAQYEEAMADA